MKTALLAGILPLGLAAAALAQPPAPPPDHSNRIVLIGTRGGPSADAVRSESANILMIDGTPYEIDAGSGTARQLAAAGIPLARVHTIFITHHHLDHTAGLEPIISLGWIGQGLTGKPPVPVNIYGPPATEYLVKAALDYLSVSQRIFTAGIPSLPKPESFFFGHDMAPGLVFQDRNVKVTAVENTHFSHPSYGPDGKKDMAFSYRFDTSQGSVVYTGDTGPSAAVNDLAKGADVLVSEVYLPGPGATTANPDPKSSVASELAEHMTREHLTPTEVGKLATAAGVKAVILSHVVANNAPEAIKALRDGVAATYKGPIYVGSDLMSFRFEKGTITPETK